MRLVSGGSRRSPLRCTIYRTLLPVALARCFKLRKVDQLQCIRTVRVLLYITNFQEMNAKLTLPLKQFFCSYRKGQNWEPYSQAIKPLLCQTKFLNPLNSSAVMHESTFGEGGSWKKKLRSLTQGWPTSTHWRERQFVKDSPEGRTYILVHVMKSRGGGGGGIY